MEAFFLYFIFFNSSNPAMRQALTCFPWKLERVFHLLLPVSFFSKFISAALQGNSISYCSVLQYPSGQCVWSCHIVHWQKTVQDIKDLMFCRENSALKILCIPVVLWSIMGSLAIKYHLKTQVTAKSLTQNGRQQLLEFEDWHNLVYEFGQMLLSSSFQACC